MIDMNLLNEFKVEVHEHLEIIENNLLSFEKQDDPLDTQLIDSIFRAIHSVKGSSGFFSFHHITKLSHIMETLLQKIREAIIEPKQTHIDSLLAGNDALKLMIQDPLQSENVDITSIYDQISQLTAQEQSDNTISHTHSDHDDLPQRDSQHTYTDDKEREKEHFNRIDDVPQLKNLGFDIDDTLIEKFQDKNLFMITLNLSKLEFEKGIDPASIVYDVNGMGDILDSFVDVKEIDSPNSVPSQEICLIILYATHLTAHLLPIALNVSNFKVLISQKNSPIDLSKKQTIQKPFVNPQQSPLKNDSQDNHSHHIAKKNTPESVQLSNHTAKKITPESVQLSNNSIKMKSNNKPLTDIKKKANPLNLNDQSSLSINPSTIRLNVEILDTVMNLVGELVLVRNQQLLLVDHHNAKQIDNSQRLDMVTSQLQDAIMRTRMQPIGTLFSRLSRIVRDMSKYLDKSIILITKGNEVELDKAILESLVDPFIHIIRNACDHGIEKLEYRIANGKSETGYIKVNAYHEGGQISIIVEDDGKGIDTEIIKKKALFNGLKTEDDMQRMNEKEILSLVMMPGFSTVDTMTEISGRGVGMDVVKRSIEDLGGTIDLQSLPGKGTTLHMRLPLTLAIIPSVIVIVNNERFAIPKVNVEELVSLYDDEIYSLIECDCDQEVYRLRDNLLPMVRLSEIIQRKNKFTEETRTEISRYYQDLSLSKLQDNNINEDILMFAVLKIGIHRFGLIVDEVLGTEEIVVNPLHSATKYLRIYSGTTIMGDGTVALILDVNGISNHAGIHFSLETEKKAQKGFMQKSSEVHRIMLFKCGSEEQFGVPLRVMRRVELIYAERIQKIGDNEFVSIDGITTMVIRLENYFNVSPCVMKERMYLILPKEGKNPMGILISQLIDVIDMPLELSKSYSEKTSMMNTLLIDDIITIFLDLFILIDMVDSECSIEKSHRTDIPKDKKKHRILLVEDSPFFQRMIKSHLEASNYIIHLANNGLEGLTILENEEIDIIASDIEMPEMNGLEFIQKVRRHDKFKNIPAIAVTSLDSDKDKAKGIEAGFDDYLIKFDRIQLLNKINELLAET